MSLAFYVLLINTGSPKRYFVIVSLQVFVLNCNQVIYSVLGIDKFLTQCVSQHLIKLPHMKIFGESVA